MKLLSTSEATRTGWIVPHLSIFIVGLGLSIVSGCATPHAILNFTAPSAATAGSAFTITVTVTIGGNRDTIINSPIHFTSSDPAAILPPDYYFTAADSGSHTWTNGVTLMTPGNQLISGVILDGRNLASGINGHASVTVSP